MGLGPGVDHLSAEEALRKAPVDFMKLPTAILKLSVLFVDAILKISAIF